jgi:hypothetical protein
MEEVVTVGAATFVDDLVRNAGRRRWMAGKKKNAAAPSASSDAKDEKDEKDVA